MTIVHMEARRFERTGLLAIDPKAFLEMFIPPAAAAENVDVGGVTVVDISGPLTQRADYWCDSYDAILARVRAACDSSCTAVVLRVDSPGGDAQGCFETARELRAMCAAAGKPLYAFVTRACSAAYAIASAAQYIAVNETATVGSVGVLSTRVDYSAANAQQGVRVAFVTSGARKTDGHPDAPITEAELAAEQQIVDGLAAVFFGLVAEHRNVTPKAIEQLDARVLLGASAVSAGLADGVATFPTLLALIAAGGTEEKRMTPYEEAIAAITKAAEGDSPDAKAMQAALAAIKAAKGEGDGDKEPDGDEEPKPDAADPDEEKPAARAASRKRVVSAAELDLVALAAKVHDLEARAAEREERDERASLLATRPDFGPEVLAICKAAPLETVRDMVAKLPKGKVTAKHAAAAQSDVKPLQGAADGVAPSTTHPDVLERMERQLGMRDGAPQAVDTPYRMTFGAPPATGAKKGGN